MLASTAGINVSIGLNIETRKKAITVCSRYVTATYFFILSDVIPTYSDPVRSEYVGTTICSPLPFENRVSYPCATDMSGKFQNDTVYLVNDLILYRILVYK